MGRKANPRTPEEKREYARGWAKEYYARNRAVKLAYQSEYNKANRAEIVRKRMVRHYAESYGVTQDWIARQLWLQHGLCAVCGTAEPGGVSGFHVDHSHDTGKVRGLICMSCNVGIGHLKDSPETLAAAIRYLESPPATP